jgi:hypothetical protein
MNKSMHRAHPVQSLCTCKLPRRLYAVWTLFSADGSVFCCISCFSLVSRPAGRATIVLSDHGFQADRQAGRQPGTLATRVYGCR